MKLFYIANVRIPTEKAHGIQIVKMCEAFASKGLEVELIIPDRINPIGEDVFKFYDVKKNFKITRLYSFNFFRPERINSFFIYMQALLFAFAIFFHVLFNPNKFGRDDTFYLRDEFSPWLLILLNKKVFLEMHAFKKRFKCYRFFFPKLKGLILITQNAKNEFIAAGVKEEKISIAPDAVDFIKFNTDILKEEAREKLGLPLDKKIIAYTGSFYLYDWKGIDVLLNSSKYLSQDYLFVLIGGKNKEIEKIKNIYQSNNILSISQKSHSQIPLFLKSADVLIIPNKKGDLISEKYTSPLKMFEYMASKRPIVASDLPSIREILNENNAVLVEPNNPKSLAEGIKKVLTDQGLSQKITDQAFCDVQNYTWEKRVESILNFVSKQ